MSYLIILTDDARYVMGQKWNDHQTEIKQWKLCSDLKLKPITDEDNCKKAAKALRLNYLKAVNVEDFPNGCLYWINHVRFNIA